MKITPSPRARGDLRLLRIVLDNLLCGALEFAGRRTHATGCRASLRAIRHEPVARAHGEVGESATFSFTLGEPPGGREGSGEYEALVGRERREREDGGW